MIIDVNADLIDIFGPFQGADPMRICVAIAPIILAAMTHGANSETWSGTEGVCNDWRTQWRMTKNGNNYSGAVTGSQVPVANCTGGGGIINGQATAVITGGRFSANRVTTPDNSTCNFNGTVTGDDITGTYTCTNGGPYNFSLSR